MKHEIQTPIIEQQENYQKIIDRYIALRDDRIDYERARGWDPLVYKDHYNEIARAHPDVLAAYMDIIENKTDQFGTYTLDIAEFAPKYALSLQNLLKQNWNLLRLYAQNSEHFKEVNEEMIQTGEIVPGTRLSSIQDEGKIHTYIRRNQRLTREFCKRLQTEGTAPAWQASNPKFIIERMGQLYKSDTIRVWFNFIYNKRQFSQSSIMTIDIDTPFYDQRNTEEFGNCIYDLRMFPDGMLTSGSKTFVNREKEGYMFIKPTPRMLNWQKENRIEKVFDEEVFINAIIKSKDLKSEETQLKLKTILSPVDFQLKKDEI